MQQRLTFLTLGARNLENLKRFYQEKFGWEPMKDSDGIVFFRLNGIILGLFPLEELAEDACAPAEGEGFKGFTMALNLDSPEAVDATFADLKARGVEIVKDPQEVFWGGYSGYVADVEGNRWEIAFNPFLEMDAAGNVLRHV